MAVFQIMLHCKWLPGIPDRLGTRWRCLSECAHHMLPPFRTRSLPHHSWRPQKRGKGIDRTRGTQLSASLMNCAGNVLQTQGCDQAMLPLQEPCAAQSRDSCSNHCYSLAREVRLSHECQATRLITGAWSGGNGRGNLARVYHCACELKYAMCSTQQLHLICMVMLSCVVWAGIYWPDQT